MCNQRVRGEGYQGRIQRGAHPARAPLKLDKIWFFGVKSWFFTRNTTNIFAPHIPCLLYIYGKHLSYCIISCLYRDSINTIITFHVLIHPYYFLNKQNLQIKLLYIQMFQYITSILYIMHTIIFVYSFNIQNKTNSRQPYIYNIYIAWVA
jgi:hypothetical protein